MQDIELVKRMAQDSSHIQFNGDFYPVCYCDHEDFEPLDDDDCQGLTVEEENGGSMFIAYSEVDLDRDMFYKIVLMDVNEYKEVA